MNADANDIASIINNLIQASNDKAENRTWKRGVIASVQGQMCSAYVEGNSYPTNGIICLDSYQPTVSDKVLILSIGTSGSNLVVVGAINNPQVTWYSISNFQAGWTNYGKGWEIGAYTKTSSGTVYLRGLLTGGKTSDDNTIFTLPQGYRPATNSHVPIAQNGANSYVHIYNDGRVTTGADRGNAWLSLGGISFIAEQ